MKMIWSFSGVQNDINQTTLWIDKFYVVCYNRDVKRKSQPLKKRREKHVGITNCRVMRI